MIVDNRGWGHEMKLQRKTLAWVTVLLLLLGGAAIYLKPRFVPWKKTNSAVSVSYCDLGNNPDRYKHKLVRVEATTIGMAEGYLYLLDQGCDFGIEANYTLLSFDGEFVPNAEIREWLDKLPQDQNATEQRTHKAIVTGWFNGQISEGCWGPKYGMTAINIEPI